MTDAATRAIGFLLDHDPINATAALQSPADATDYAALGMVRLAGGEWGAAHRALRQAVALGDASPVTLLNLALAEDRLGLPGRARMELVALAAPEWDEPWLRLAESCRRAGEQAAAIGHYEAALERQPNRPEALLGLASVLIQSGKAGTAEGLLLRCCGVAPHMAEAWDALGMALTLAGTPSLAESAFAEAHRLQPHNLRIALRRVDAAFAAGAGEAELARLELLAEREPLNIVCLTARGVLLDRLGRAGEAADVLEAACALDPEAAGPAAAFAGSLLHAGRFMAAIPALRHAVALSPGEPALRNDLAAALNRVHRYDEARRILEQLIADHGETAIFLCNLCNSLVSLGQQWDGVAMARRATVLAPQQPLAWRTLANALVYADAAVTPELTGALRQAGATLPRAEAVTMPTPSDPERRLRIGLLSANLRTHPVGWLTVAAFESLPTRDFDIVCFGQPLTDDPMTRRFRAVSAEWHPMPRRSASDIAAAVRACGVDILIDLGGWGDQGMLQVLAQRAAPVQIRWVGMQCHSSGVAEVDWFISDRWETPDGAQTAYCERLLCLPDGYVCYSPPPLAPDPTPLPAIARGSVTFGCFNNLAKITPETIATWSTILLQVPRSRLVLKAHQFSDPAVGSRIAAAFAAHGVEAGRIEPRGSTSHREQLAQHADIDIMLDPFPYSGGLSTCEALWMGVPVITLPGETFASRHSTSHLHNVGLPDWVAADRDSYATIAVARAQDLISLAELRAGLRARMRASPLCDAQRFGRNLGLAFRDIWRDACRR